MTDVSTAPCPPTDADTAERADRVQRFEQLYGALYDDLWRYCRRRTGSDEAADDAVADVMSVAWRRLDDVPPGDRARPWLFGVARNHVRSRWRGRRRDDDLTTRLVHERHVQPIAPETPVDDLASLAAALAALKEPERELIQLAVWDELPHAEIALALGCSENAVAIRLHRVRAKLASATERTS